MEAIVGKPVTIPFIGGSGQFLAPVVEPEDALLAEVESEKLALTVQKGGEPKVTLTDAKTQAIVSLQVRAFMLAFEWANIPAGTFMMGRPDSALNAYTYPQYVVRISAFRLATT